MLVTDPGIASLGLHEQLLEWIREEGIECVVYDRTTANPTIANVEEALQLYRENGCHALIAFGGGSPMDCAKGVGARVGGLRELRVHVPGRAGGHCEDRTGSGE